MARATWGCLALLLCLSGVLSVHVAYDKHGNKLYNDGIVPKDLEDGRLPTALEPTHYHIEIRPDIYTANPPFVNFGTVSIFFHVEEDTDQIVLNYDDLTFIHDSFELINLNASDPAPDITVIGVIPEADFLVIALDDEMDAGESYVLTMDFLSEINDPGEEREGLYYDTYEHDEEIRYIMGSHLRPGGAREVFPCFDEPGLKATFDIKILRKEGYHAVSNGELIEEEERPDDWIADHFTSTPYMSTYLLAFVVVDFHYIETNTSDGAIHRFWARHDVLEGSEFTIDIISHVTDWLEDYTDIENMISVTDHVVLPGAFGGMESWGCIMYGEDEALWHEDWYSANNQLVTATLVASNIANFWFGNLVSFEWWSDAWMTEGFAAYFEAEALSAIGWPASRINYHRRVRVAFAADLDKYSMPVRPEIETPWDAYMAFTTSSYSKGSAIVRMIANILEPEIFQHAIQEYLQEYQLSSVDSDDLWEHLDEICDDHGITDPDGDPVDFKEKFDSWILQPGYPLIRALRNYETETITLTQSHFDPWEQEWPPSEFGYRWNIPITIYHEEEHDHPGPPPWLELDAWMDRVPAITLEDQMPENDTSWYLVNPAARFFYRVQYDKRNIENINNQLEENHHAITGESRAAYLDDMFALARAHILSEVDAFEAADYLDEEYQSVPWLVFISNLEYIERLLERYPDTEEHLEDFLEDLCDEVYESLGWEFDWDNENIFQLKLREEIIEMACENDNVDCVATAVQRFEEWQTTPPEDNPVEATLREVVYCTGVREGDRADWDSVYERYQWEGEDHMPYYEEEQWRLLDALTCTEDEDILQEYYHMMFDPEQIEEDDALIAILSLADSPVGREVVWEHLKTNWADDPVPEGVERGLVLHAVVAGFATEDDQLDLAEFMAMYPPEDEEDEEDYEIAINIVKENRYWAEINQASLHDWLSENTQPRKT